MRLIFAGTPQFAAVSLRHLLSRGHQIVLVLTQPDRPSGRGLRPSISAVKEAAQRYGLAVDQPPSLRDSALQQALADTAVDAWVVAAYGLILPQAILQAPRYGCLNVHASLLPRWRGAAPIQRAIMAGDRETGIAIMRMDEGLDTGPVFLQRAIALEPHDTAGTVHDKLALLGAQMVAEVLDDLAAGVISPVAQSAEGVCYAAKIQREETLIDWARPAAEIERMVRALDPAPGAYTRFAGKSLKVWRVASRRRSSSQRPGTVLDSGPEGIEVMCADASLALTELQRSGGRRLNAAEFLRGCKIQPGAWFGA